MCGISAILARRKGIPRSVLQGMTDAVAHRGPDGFGFEFFDADGTLSTGDTDWTIGLGHRRLSIIDLESTGHQPMAYNELWITFNGEIYNYLELRDQLRAEGYSFKSNSDTEVILAAYAHWGTGCFAKLRGMWGLILWDVRKRKLIASRDRMGIKPLYYFVGDNYVAFGSEIKQFRCVPGFIPMGDHQVIKEYVLTGFERDDKTFFKSVMPVPPGTYTTFELDTAQIAKPESYWNPEKILPVIKDVNAAADELRQVFNRSVGIHLRSDVPVGCQLSGGLDSSSVLSSMSGNYSGEQLHSFTVSFPGFKMDETPFVERMLKGDKYVAHYTTPDITHFLEEAKHFAWHHDEPVGSFAHYAGFDLARLIGSCQIKVVLNGQGGDEILGGYWQQYFTFLFSHVRSMNWKLVVDNLAGAMLQGGNETLIRQIAPMLRRYMKRRAVNPDLFTSQFKKVNADNYLEKYFELSPEERRIFDIRRLILPRLLKWDDRNLMAFSVEGRYPLLDHEVIECALRMDQKLLYHRGWNKYPLRKAMVNQLPPEICYRKSKWGFETPQISWLGNEMMPGLRKWVGEEKPLDMVVAKKGLIETLTLFFKYKKPGRRPEAF
ncbi:MAG: asparagine synthase (glutamine-hydrolyzing) [Cytophagales bacterium]|nr:asparagine synthase (glutamine-hydrolyzing) [Cytophagales bacterium]